MKGIFEAVVGFSGHGLTKSPVWGTIGYFSNFPL